MTNRSIYNRYSPSLTPKTTRDNPVWLFVFHADEVLMKVTNGTFDLPVKCNMEDLKLQAVAKYYLGQLDGCDCYCIVTADQTNVPEGLVFKKFRAILGRVDEEIFMLAGRAYQIVNWDKKNRYCGCCGSENEIKNDEFAKVCPRCRNIMYPKISPAVIVAIINGNQILLAHARHFKENLYSLIAGFVEPGETFEDCVKREVLEEVGLKVKNLQYFGSQPWPFPDSLMVGFTAEYESGQISVDGQEITSASWFAKESLPDTPNNSSIAGKIISWWVEN